MSIFLYVWVLILSKYEQCTNITVIMFKQKKRSTQRMWALFSLRLLLSISVPAFYLHAYIHKNSCVIAIDRVNKTLLCDTWYCTNFHMETCCKGQCVQHSGILLVAVLQLLYSKRTLFGMCFLHISLLVSTVKTGHLLTITLKPCTQVEKGDLWERWNSNSANGCQNWHAVTYIFMGWRLAEFDVSP